MSAKRGKDKSNDGDGQRGDPDYEHGRATKRTKKGAGPETRSKTNSKPKTQGKGVIQLDGMGGPPAANAPASSSQSKESTGRRGRPKKQDSISSLKARVVSAERRAEQRENTAADWQKKYDSLHERSLAASDVGKAYYQDDRKITKNVELLFKMTANWAAEFAHEEHLRKHLSQVQVGEILIYISNIYPEANNSSRVDMEKLSWCTAGCRYMAEAWVSAIIIEDVFMQPFHFSEGLHQHVQQLKKHMRRDSYDTLLFNSRVLRSLYYAEEFEGSITEPIFDGNFAEGRRNYYGSIAASLLDGPKLFSKLLQHRDDEQLQTCRDELLSIMNAAGKLALQIWVQDCSVEITRDVSADDDLFVDLRNKRCDSKTTIKSNATTRGPRNLRADFWLRMGMCLTRYETYGAAGTSVSILNPMFVSIDDEKWQKNREEHVQTSRDVSTPDPNITATDSTIILGSNTMLSDQTQVVSQKGQDVLSDGSNFEMLDRLPKDLAETDSGIASAYFGADNNSSSSKVKNQIDSSIREAKMQEVTHQPQAVRQAFHLDEQQSSQTTEPPELCSAANIIARQYPEVSDSPTKSDGTSRANEAAEEEDSKKTGEGKQNEDVDSRGSGDSSSQSLLTSESRCDHQEDPQKITEQDPARLEKPGCAVQFGNPGISRFDTLYPGWRSNRDRQLTREEFARSVATTAGLSVSLEQDQQQRALESDEAALYPKRTQPQSNVESGEGRAQHDLEGGSMEGTRNDSTNRLDSTTKGSLYQVAPTANADEVDDKDVSDRMAGQYTDHKEKLQRKLSEKYGQSSGPIVID